MSVSINELFNSSPEKIKNYSNNILNYFKNGNKLLEELSNLASIAYQCYTKGEGKGRDEEMDDGEDKIEEQNESSDNEAIGDATKQRRKALATISANNKNLPKTIESEQATKERSERKLDRAKRRAQNSQLVRELRDELEDGPEEIREEHPVFANDGLESRHAEARRRYEETNFVRLGMSREERKAARRRKHNTSMADELGKLLEFGRYKIDNDDEIEGRKVKTNYKGHKKFGTKMSSVGKEVDADFPLKRKNRQSFRAKGTKKRKMKKRIKR
ncbi:hypothetical protein ACQ4LE_008896 [Meloidogyne hapla]|uniref:Protein SDA1 n=1 Tax=Meloidogyne hapla TaxID=6305 RepID=A0A1I8BFX8_MELHA